MPVTAVKTKWSSGNMQFRRKSDNMLLMTVDASTPDINVATGVTFTVTDGISGTSLDGAYNTGRTITVDAGAVILAGAQATANTLQITEASGSGSLIDLAQSGTGKDIDGTASSWYVSKAGAATFATIASGTITLSGDIDMSAEATGTYDIILKASVADGLSIKFSSTDMVVFDTNTPKITFTPITTFTGAITASAGLTCTTGGLTVSAGTTTAIASTNIGLTGIVTVTGTLTVTGDMTWGGTFTTDELILDSDGSAPAATFAYVVSDNTGDLTVNALSGKTFNVAINGNDEFVFTGTALQVSSGDNIQFMGNNGILDSAGNEVILVTAVGSAVNYLNVRNAATANPIILECLGTVDKGFQFHNDQSEPMLTLTPIATGVDYVDIKGGDATTMPTISVAGATANIHLVLAPKGTGAVQINNGTDPCVIQVMGAQGSYTNEIHDVNGNELLAFWGVASAIYEFGIVNAATGGKPTLQTVGAVDIGMDFETSEGEEMLTLTPVSSATVNINLTSAATGLAPSISTIGEEDIGIKFTNFGGEPMLVLASAVTAVDYITISSAAAAGKPTIATTGAADIGMIFQTSEAEEILVLAATSAAVCEVTITSAATGNPARIAATGEGNSNLQIGTTGTGKITIDVGADEILQIDDAAITFAAAADTAGHAIYIKTEAGGTDGGSGSGRAGALLYLSTGAGSASTTATAVGGAGGALTVITGIGGIGNTTGNGGAGGALALVTAAGGVGGAGASVGGVGGSLTITAGAGGAAGEDAGSTGGNGGSIVLTAGAAGGAGGSGGTAGLAGLVNARGIFTQKMTQTALADTATLTIAQLLTKIIDGTPTGAANYQMPAAAAVIAGMPGVAVGDSFFFVINNKSAGANTITVTAGGATLDGTLTIAQNFIRLFLLTVTGIGGGAAYSVYGVGDSA